MNAHQRTRLASPTCATLFLATYPAVPTLPLPRVAAREGAMTHCAIATVQLEGPYVDQTCQRTDGRQR